MLGNIPIGRTGPAVRWWCTLVGMLAAGMNALAQPAVPDQPPEGKAPHRAASESDPMGHCPASPCQKGRAVSGTPCGQHSSRAGSGC